MKVAVEEGIFGDVKVELHPDNDHCVIIKRAAPQIEAEADNVEEEQENEEPAKEAPTKKGKAASGKAASDNAAPESESQEEADDYDELVPKSHGGTKVVLQIDGICNPVSVTLPSLFQPPPSYSVRSSTDGRSSCLGNPWTAQQRIFDG